MNENNEFDINEIKMKMKNGIYYILTALLSIVSIIVFPMLDNSNLTFKDTFPTTATGWTLWIIERVLIIVMNLLILNNFVLQARRNIKDNDNYIQANKILDKYKPKGYKPQSPSQYMSRMYLKKGGSLTITAAASLITIGEAAVNYNYLLLIATVVTIVFAIVFGVVAMHNTEMYWTTEYLDYAHMIEDNRNKIEEKEIKQCLQSMECNIETCKSKS